jgi:predicted outer membrane repeat protein
LVSQGITDVNIIGVGQDIYNYGLPGMVQGRVLPWTEDSYYDGLPIWTRWGAEQRSIYLLNRDGSLDTTFNITPFDPNIPDDYAYIKNLILELRNKGVKQVIHIPDDYATIQEGINTASDGDTVLVKAGSYVENINFNGKNIVIGSLTLITGDPSHISQTVIDGNQSGSVITFGNGEDSTVVLCGVTITNGATATNGGGINCFNGSKPTLEKVTICRNSAQDYGGGIYCSFNCNPCLVNVIIIGNTAFHGGGIYCNDNSNPILVNSILWNNSPQEIYFADSGNPNSITVAYSDVQGGETGIETNNNGTANWLKGNIDSDPLLVDADNGDFHLLGGSLCIDAGTALFVWEGDTLVNLGADDYIGSAPDMGAFEYYEVTSITDHISLTPSGFSLHQNYPNPFNSTTTLRYNLPQKSHVTIVIYDMLGRRVRSIVSRVEEAGYKSVTWDAKDDLGKPVSSGVYLYQIRVGDLTKTCRMVLLK